jgi:hypothetical protein
MGTPKKDNFCSISKSLQVLTWTHGLGTQSRIRFSGKFSKSQGSELVSLCCEAVIL